VSYRHDGRTDRRTDSFSALYIDAFINHIHFPSKMTEKSPANQIAKRSDICSKTTMQAVKKEQPAWQSNAKLPWRKKREI